MAPRAQRNRRSRKSRNQPNASTPSIEVFRDGFQAYFVDPGHSVDGTTSSLLEAVEDVSVSEEDHEQTPVPSASTNVLVEKDTQGVAGEARNEGNIIDIADEREHCRINQPVDPAEARRQELERLLVIDEARYHEEERYQKCKRMGFAERCCFLDRLPDEDRQLLMYECRPDEYFDDVMNAVGDGGPMDRLKRRMEKRVSDGVMPWYPPVPKTKIFMDGKLLPQFLSHTLEDRAYSDNEPLRLFKDESGETSIGGDKEEVKKWFDQWWQNRVG